MERRKRRDFGTQTSKPDSVKFSIASSELMDGPPGYRSKPYPCFQKVIRVNLEEAVDLRKKRVTKNAVLLGLATWALFQVRDAFIGNWLEPRMALYRAIIAETSMMFTAVFLAPLILHTFTVKNCISYSTMGIGLSAVLYSFPQLPYVAMVSIFMGTAKAVFLISMPIYLVKSAIIYGHLTGTSITQATMVWFGYHETFFNLRFAATAIMNYLLFPDLDEDNEDRTNCGLVHCQEKPLDFVTPLVTEVRFHLDHTMMLTIIVMTCISLSAIIIISMNLDSLDELSGAEYVEEPSRASVRDVLRQFLRPKGCYVGVLWAVIQVINAVSDEIDEAFIECWRDNKYRLYTQMTSYIAAVHAALCAPTLVEIFGEDFVFGMALATHLCVYTILVLCRTGDTITDFSIFLISSVLRYASTVVLPIIYAMVWEILGDEEVATWCFVAILYSSTTCICIIGSRIFCMTTKFCICTASCLILAVTYMLLQRTRIPCAAPVEINPKQLYAIEKRRDVIFTDSYTNIDVLMKLPVGFYVKTDKVHEFIIEESIDDIDGEIFNQDIVETQSRRFVYKDWSLRSSLMSAVSKLSSAR